MAYRGLSNRVHCFQETREWNTAVCNIFLEYYTHSRKKHLFHSFDIYYLIHTYASDKCR